MLQKLCNLIGVSGYENNVAEYIFQYLQNHCSGEALIDNIGNVIYHQKGISCDKKMLLLAHMDEVGFQIVKKIEQGKYQFKTLGNVKMWNINHQIVEFSDGNKGVVYANDETVISGKNTENMFVEIIDRENLDIEIGSTFSFENKFYDYGNYFMGKALDNRISCYCLLESLKHIKGLKQDLFVAFTTMEEVNMRGARVAVSTIKPDIIVNVDVSPVGKMNSLVMGEGVGVKISDSIGMSDSSLVNNIKRIAINNKIIFQLEVSDCGTSEILIVNENDWGAKNVGFSIPCEHIHSSKVKVNKEDAFECIKLLNCILQEL